MRRFLRSVVVALALVAWTARTTDGVLLYTWQWVSTPGQPNGGFWTLIAIEPYFGY